MNCALVTAPKVQPSGARPGSCGGAPRARANRSIAVSAAEGQRNGMSRRHAVSSMLFAGLSLVKIPIANADDLTQLPEPLEITEETPIVQEVSSVVAPASTLRTPRVMTSEVTATSDPVILSGAGALVLGVIGVVAMMPKSADKPEVQDIKQQAEKSADTVKVAELAAVEKECVARQESLAALQKELAELSKTVATLSAAQGAAFEALKKAGEAMNTAQVEACNAKISLSEAQSAYEDAARKNALAKLISQLSGGKTVEFYQSKVAEAEAMARKSAAESFEAAAKDRRAWIANWRASSELEKAKKANDSKAAEVSVLGTLVQESLNRRQELRLELGLAEDGETGVVVPSMEDSADMRVKDRQEWIAAYRAKQGIAPAAGASALAFKEPFQSMVADRRAWIAAWRERTAAKAVVNA